MAVEYIDSPNAGFVKLGEGVGLSTITPQRKRKVKKGDRAIFPITPTGAESYETTDFRPAAGFTSPASTIPNVFDRYKDLPGGARAGGTGPESSFERVILPINPNGTNESITEDLELEEQLRRKSFDIGLDADPSGRTDPSSPNYDPTAVGEQAYADVLTGGDFFSSLDRFGIDQFSGDAAAISFSALDKAKSDVERAQNLVNKTQAGTRIGDFALNALNSANRAQQELQTINDVIGKRGAAPSGDIPTTVPEQQRDFRGLTANEARFFSGQNVLGSIGGTGFTTNVPKASFESDEIFDPVVTLGFSPSVSPGVTETQGEDFGAASIPTGAGGAPTVGSVERDFSLSGINIPDAAEIEAQQGFAAAEQAGADSLEDFSGLFNRGGKVQSFMNMKK